MASSTTLGLCLWKLVTIPASPGFQGYGEDEIRQSLLWCSGNLPGFCDSLSVLKTLPDYSFLSRMEPDGKHLPTLPSGYSQARQPLLLCHSSHFLLSCWTAQTRVPGGMTSGQQWQVRESLHVPFFGLYICPCCSSNLGDDFPQ